MTDTVVTSACYFPPAIFFKHFRSAKNILVDEHEYFVKQTLRNRTYICGANGKFPLIVPMKHTGGKLTAMKDTLISYDTPWQKVHWRSLISAYHNSPYFEFYEDEMAPFFFAKEKFLFGLNEKILQTLLRISGASGEIRKTDKYVHNYSQGETDLRMLSDPSVFTDSLKIDITQTYSQLFTQADEFIPGLSILDWLFNVGKNQP